MATSSVTYKSNFGKVIKSLVDGTAANIIAPVADNLTAKIKTATPVLTGTTRDSISRMQHSKFGHTIKSEHPASRYIEFGTEDTPTFAMFRKTFDQNVISMAKELEEKFKKHIETAAK